MTWIQKGAGQNSINAKGGGTPLLGEVEEKGHGSFGGQ